MTKEVVTNLETHLANRIIDCDFKCDWLPSLTSSVKTEKETIFSTVESLTNPRFNKLPLLRTNFFVPSDQKSRFNELYC